ncbi:hypothetical protein [Lysinibacillus halotolerans]|uniref:Uncharacterized protein n=1 Tax=Lysinibacillus halotolerans TaxID=1368476 RepID=A0A3M8H5G3_9BACI|nr:hypothetical protein [Lysinibacillus halotolerans]RNC97623.1 hypothetical protein EC501_14480 [Lysinibacillus halotolerans]
MNDWYRLGIIVLVFAVQHFLSTRNERYLGSIIPIGYLAFILYVYTTDIVDWSILKLALYFILGEAFLIGYWISGRKIVANKTQKELEKMKAREI